MGQNLELVECWRRELDLQGGQSCFRCSLFFTAVGQLVTIRPRWTDSRFPNLSQLLVYVAVHVYSRRMFFYVRANCGCEFVINVVTRDKMSQEIVTG